MKQTMKTIKMWAALLVAVVALAACSSDAESEVTPRPSEPAAPQAPTFTMTVSAQKGGDGTRGTLTDNTTTISSAWEADDEVSVYNVTKSAALTGTLKAQSAGSSTTLSGELTGSVDTGDQLTLSYKSASYATQDGTLEGIAANCDYAIATVIVTDVSGGSITTDAASFQSQQAIVKFTLQNSTGSDVLSASELKVVADGNTYTITPASATSILYVALPGFSSKAITLVATVSGTTYVFSKSGVTFADGNFYRINVKMSQGGALSAVTTADLGKVIGSDGLIYSTASSVPSPFVASAIIAYVGTAGSVDASSSTYKGLAIALTDANSGSTRQWYTANSGTCVNQNSAIATALTYKNGIASTNTLTSDGHTHAAATAAKNFSTARPSGTSAWFLPSMGQWNLIVQGLATKKAGSTVSTNLTTSSNSAYNASNLNTVITAAGGTGFQSDRYWSSTEYNTGNAWYMGFSSGYAYGNLKTDNRYVRAVFAF
ncbi:MAG: hypothetical protein II822_03230 [Prevotella sp.]|nr:hypothetical protein [Prevotella sp.]